MSKIIDGFKKLGSVVSGVRHGVDLVKRGVSAVEALNDDVDGDGKKEIENLKEQAVELEEQLVSRVKARLADAKVVVASVKRDLEDLKVLAVNLLHRMEALANHVRDAGGG